MLCHSMVYNKWCPYPYPYIIGPWRMSKLSSQSCLGQRSTSSHNSRPLLEELLPSQHSKRFLSTHIQRAVRKGWPRCDLQYIFFAPPSNKHGSGWHGPERKRTFLDDQRFSPSMRCVRHFVSYDKVSEAGLSS